MHCKPVTAVAFAFLMILGRHDRYQLPCQRPRQQQLAQLLRISEIHDRFGFQLRSPLGHDGLGLLVEMLTYLPRKATLGSSAFPTEVNQGYQHGFADP